MSADAPPLVVTLEHEREVYRAMALAALDDLSAAYRVQDSLRAEIREMREERRRMAVAYFGEPVVA